MLKFLGMGSCFNPTIGYTSAFYRDKEAKRIYVFDIGGNIFERMIANNLFNGVEKVTIVITHGHSDHVGSLSDTIFYLNIALRIVPDIIYPNKSYMRGRLRDEAVHDDEYHLLAPNECQYFKIKEYRQVHNDLIEAYGYLFELDGKNIYYSGDTHRIQKEPLKMLVDGRLDYMYHEVTKYHNLAHTHIWNLKERIKPRFRHKVTCMHFDDDEVIEMAREAGFNIPKLYSKAD
ncbi:MAG: MBL fold metallo-hydrolase [Clostridia bacterium]|nr:MBL fold metallo-hydrolase [Clostridia bacterium]